MRAPVAFAGKTAIVTGGSSGIGLALSRALARRGAHVVIASRSPAKIQAALATLAVDVPGVRGVPGRSGHPTQGLSVEGHTLDVRDRAAFRSLVEQVIARRGGVDFLFNNAGMAVIGEVRDHTDQDFDDLIDVNLRGVIHGVCAVYPHMVERRTGHIVNVASVGGLIATPYGAGYTASKFGVVGLSHALRYEAERYGVRVSVVCPAGVETTMAENSRFRHIDRARFLANSPMPRDSSEHCAETILRALEKDSELVTPHVAGPLAFLHRYMPWTTRLLMRRMSRNNALLRDAYEAPDAKAQPPASQITLQ